MRRMIPFFLILFSWSPFFGCQPAPPSAPVEKEGVRYGVTEGLFLHKWWNYYERGISWVEGGFWEKAEADFREALALRNADQLRARTYGMHFLDYFPNRELGVSLFHQERFEDAVRALSTSYAMQPSAKAGFYLDKARSRVIRDTGADGRPPEISLAPDIDALLTRDASITVQGVAVDDTFVSSIRINGETVRMDVSQPRKPFDLSLPLTPGENRITVTARDLSGKKSALQRTVHCDRSGPLVNVDNLIPVRTGGKHYKLSGYAYDMAGIAGVTVNGRTLTLPGMAGDNRQCCPPNTAQIRIDAEITLRPGETLPATLTITDSLGNATTAALSPGSAVQTERSGAPAHPFNTKRPLLAAADAPVLSDGLPPFFRSIARSPSVLAYNTRGLPVSERQLKRYIRQYRSEGRDYAVIIGINQYAHWPLLKTAVNDAKKLAALLVKHYGFSPDRMSLWLDGAATQRGLMQGLRTTVAGLGENDNLLIYFAGHGQLDDLTQDGYWVPVDGLIDEPTTWITNSSIRKLLTADTIRAKNIMVIADSCYAGSLLRGGFGGTSPVDLGYEAQALELATKKSRQIIASGGIEPVADAGRDGHSLFAYYFLKALSDNTRNVIDLERLFIKNVWDSVLKSGGQRPQIGRLQTPMDENGQFVIIRSDEASDDRPPEPRPPRLKSADEVGTTEAAGAVSPSAGSQMPTPANPRSAVPLPDATPPVLSVKNWRERHEVYPTYMDKFYIEGNTKDDGGVQRLTLNGEPLILRPGQNVYFNHLAVLKPGDNQFVIRCEDAVGNVSEKKMVIRRKVPDIYEVGARMSVALYPLVRAERGDASPVPDKLLGHLIRSRRFNMKEWEAFEPPEASDDAAAESDALKRAREAGVDFVIILAVNRVAVNRAAVNPGEDSLEIGARVMEARTSELITYQDVYGEGEEIDASIIDTLCEGLVYKLQDDLPVAEGKVVAVKNDEAILNVGERQNLKKGMHLIFFKDGEVFKDPDTGEVLGADVEALGDARVHRILEKLSYAKPLENDIIAELETGIRFIMK